MSGLAAIDDLHNRPINLDDEFGRQNANDLQVWRAWSGSLIVVPAEPSRLVPRSVLSLFPALPDWAHGSSKDGMDGDLGDAQNHVGARHELDLQPESETTENKKRERDVRAGVHAVS